VAIFDPAYAVYSAPCRGKVRTPNISKQFVTDAGTNWSFSGK
jgi:hypothetical protein